MSDNKTRGEEIADKLEKEADEMVKQYEASQNGPEAKAEDVAHPEAKAEETQEENEETVETSPQESQDTEESSQAEEVQSVEEEPEPEEEMEVSESDEEETTEESSELTPSQWENRYKNAQALMTKSTQESKELKDLVSNLQAKVKDMETVQSPTAVKAAKKEVNVDLSEITKDYPELVKPLQQYVDESINQVEQKLNQAEAKLTKVQKAESDVKHFQEIEGTHPDYKSVASSEDFTVWLERQTGMWRGVASTGEPADVVALLSKYKSDIGFKTTNIVSKANLAEKAKQAVEPNLPKARKQKLGGKKRTWSRNEIKGLSTAEYEKYEKVIDQAWADGLVR
jgi:DNA repair exonuclease SbcCD ATPase subunit